MSIGKLILHSSSAESPLLEAEPLISHLQEIGLLGLPVEEGQHRFLTGECFLQLISFVGCSTNVCLAPNTDRDGGFCHLTIDGPFDQPRLLHDENIRPPRCPVCGKPIPDWKENSDGLAIKCGLCGNRSKLEDITWGRGAGYGRIFVVIYNIFPGEARPVPDLLDDLANLTATEWSYFYTGA